LIALGHLRSDGDYNTLALTDSSREVLRGEVTLLLREASAAAVREPGGRKGRRKGAASGSGAARPPPRPLDAAATARFAALKTWRAEVAKAHDLPAFVVFHDAALAEMAERQPDTLDTLGEVSGVGARKLAAYGDDILRVLRES
ncbi:MAG: HRDC domain-containing protein, partial [Caldimonas sp.]